MKQTTPILKHEEAAAKAAVLIESLPWLKRFSGQIVVIKFGGNAMVDEALFQSFAEDVVYLRYAGLKPVVVHGGGPQISDMLEKLGITSQFRGGYRVTTAETIEVARTVLSETINPELVQAINQHGELAAGLSGEQDGLFGARRREPVDIDGESVDLGFVGDVERVNPASVHALIDAGRIPVVSSLAPDIDQPEVTLNVNADAAATALAVSLDAVKLIILTDVAGLYSDWPNKDSLVSALSADDLRAMLPELESGMIPKMQACLDAVDGGVEKAAIIDGRIPHSILLEIFTSRGIGTEVTR
jgi:acetylglutamate kinase